jgi:hypothetical protein
LTENRRQKAESVLIAALAGGSTIRDAASQAGVAESTVYRRLDDANFCRQVSEVRGEMLERAVGAMADASTKAAGKLKDLLDAESEHVQLSAARSILELGVKLREATELEKRIAELEARAAEGPMTKAKRTVQ